MAGPRFRQYQHGVAPYTRRYKPDEWHKHKDLLQSLHEQHVPRRLMLDTLNDAGFFPSMGQLVSKMKQWNLMVLGQRRTSLQSSQCASTDSRVTVLDSPQSPLTDFSDTADIGLARDRDIDLGSNTDSTYLTAHQRCFTRMDLPTQHIPRSIMESVSEAADSDVANPMEGVLSLNTQILSDASDVPDLTDIGSDIASADSNTDFGANDADRTLDWANNNVCIVTDPYSTPTEPRFDDDPLFGFPSVPCDSDFHAKSLQHTHVANLGNSNYISRTHYCCLSFFTNGAVGKSSPALYWHLLDECRSTRSLKYALSLIFIWGTSPPLSLKNDARYRDLVRSAAEQYLPLATRTDTVNEYLHHISARIAGIYSSLFEEPFRLGQQDSPFVVGASKVLPTLSLEDRRRDLLSYQKPADGHTLSDDSEELSDDTTILHIAVEAREILFAKMDKLVEHARRVRNSGSSLTQREVGEVPQDNDAWALGSKLSALLLGESRFVDRGSNLIGAKKLSLDIVAEALSLVVADNVCAQSLDADASILERESSIESALDQLPARVWPVSPIAQASLMAIKMRIGLVEASRLCDNTRLVSDQHESWTTLLRSCRRNALCDLLDADITAFDKTVPREDITAPPAAWPHRSNSSKSSIMYSSSFSKLKDIARQIYLRGNGNSISSVLSNWSGHASSRSWRLENTMEVDEIPLESMLTEKDREDIDQTAFERMGGTETG